MSGMQSPQKKVDVRRCISGHRNEGEEGGGGVFHFDADVGEEREAEEVGGGEGGVL